MQDAPLSVIIIIYISMKVNISFILFLKNPRGARYHLYVEKFSLHSNYFNASCIILTKKISQ